MKINNDDYGGFIVSKSISEGYPVRYSYREESSIPALNGWTLYSIKDDEAYINEAENFVVLSGESILKVAPVLLEIFDAPYGTDLCWLYEENVHTGFYDLKDEREISIEEILNKGR